MEILKEDNDFERAKDKAAGNRNCILMCKNKTGSDLWYESEGVHSGERLFRTKRVIRPGETLRYVGGYTGRLHIKSANSDKGFYNIGYAYPFVGDYKCMIR